MPPPLQEPVTGPELTTETLRRIDILFAAADREPARRLLHDRCGHNLPFCGKSDSYDLERIRFAALRYSDGNLAKLEFAVRMAEQDWRDLLMSSGFAGDTAAHRSWEPKPAGEPSQVDPLALAEAIHQRLAEAFAPLGFERQGDVWRREGEVPQTLRLAPGYSNRTEAKFFLKAALESEPAVVMHLPKLPPDLFDAREQGYVFHAGADAAEFAAATAADAARHLLPLFRRFTTRAEVQRGMEDGSFPRRLQVSGQIWMF